MVGMDGWVDGWRNVLRWRYIYVCVCMCLEHTNIHTHTRTQVSTDTHTRTNPLSPPFLPTKNKTHTKHKTHRIKEQHHHHQQMPYPPLPPPPRATISPAASSTRPSPSSSPFTVQASWRGQRRQGWVGGWVVEYACVCSCIYYICVCVCMWMFRTMKGCA
jgi:hypothetical protein